MYYYISIRSESTKIRAAVDLDNSARESVGRFQRNVKAVTLGSKLFRTSYVSCCNKNKNNIKQISAIEVKMNACSLEIYFNKIKVVEFVFFTYCNLGSLVNKFVSGVGLLHFDFDYIIDLLRKCCTWMYYILMRNATKKICHVECLPLEPRFLLFFQYVTYIWGFSMEIRAKNSHYCEAVVEKVFPKIKVKSDVRTFFWGVLHWKWVCKRLKNNHLPFVVVFGYERRPHHLDGLIIDIDGDGNRRIIPDAVRSCKYCTIACYNSGAVVVEARRPRLMTLLSLQGYQKWICRGICSR